MAEPTLRTRYSVVELLMQCDVSAEISVEDRTWPEDNPPEVNYYNGVW